jgi:hypothetical protein
VNEVHLNNTVTNTICRNKKKGTKIKLLCLNSNNKYINLYEGINKFKKGYQPRISSIKSKNSNLLADSCKILTCEKITPISYHMYMGLMMLRRNAYS